MASQPPIDPPPAPPAGADPAPALPAGDPLAPLGPAAAGPEAPAGPDAPPLPAPAPPPEAPWGPLASFGFSLLVLFIYSILQGALVLPALAASVPAAPPPASPGVFPPVPNAGLLFAAGTILAAPVGIGMLWMLARARRRGLAPAAYLGLRRPAGRDVLLGVVLLGLFSFTYDVVASRLGRPDVPDFMVEAFRTAVYLPVLWVAVVVAAPVFEELLFRGFLLEGLRRSWAGAAGAALGSSLLFALIHLQYDWFDMSAIFGLGLLFAAMRVKSGSTWLTIGLHALTNLVSMIQVASHLKGS